MWNDEAVNRLLKDLRGWGQLPRTPLIPQGIENRPEMDRFAAKYLIEAVQFVANTTES